MADRGRHAADLAVLAFGEFERDPTSRHGFAEADGRMARTNFRLRIEQPCARGKCFAALNGKPLRELFERIGRWSAFHLRPIRARMRAAGVQQTLI